MIISHSHSDHHFGIIEFLETRMELFAKYINESKSPISIPEIYIVLPSQIISFYLSLNKSVENLNAVFID